MHQITHLPRSLSLPQAPTLTRRPGPSGSRRPSWSKISFLVFLEEREPRKKTSPPYTKRERDTNVMRRRQKRFRASGRVGPRLAPPSAARVRSCALRTVRAMSSSFPAAAESADAARRPCALRRSTSTKNTPSSSPSANFRRARRQSTPVAGTAGARRLRRRRQRSAAALAAPWASTLRTRASLKVLRCPAPCP